MDLQGYDKYLKGSKSYEYNYQPTLYLKFFCKSH